MITIRPEWSLEIPFSPVIPYKFQKMDSLHFSGAMRLMAIKMNANEMKVSTGILCFCVWYIGCDS